MGSFIGRSKSTRNTLAVLEAGRHSGKPVILWGPPGVGKTALIRALAAKYDLPLFILIASTMDPTDVDGLPALKQIVLPDGTEATVTENTLPHWARELITEGRGILFWDELSTAVPTMQAAALSVLQGRRVGKHTLPKDVWIIAAANEAADAADGWELAAPMANRFIHVTFEPDDEDFLQGMTVAWNDEVTDRELEERAKIVSFLKAYPTLINNMPSNAEEAGKAWPSYRSWDNCASMLSYIDSRSARTIAIEGAVGKGAAQQFLEWERSLSLPDYDEVLAHPEKVQWKTHSAAEVYIILSMILGRMNDRNVEASAEVFAQAAKLGEKADVCSALAFPLIDKINSVGVSREKTAVLIGKTLREYAPYLVKAKIN